MGSGGKDDGAWQDIFLTYGSVAKTLHEALIRCLGIIFLVLEWSRGYGYPGLCSIKGQGMVVVRAWVVQGWVPQQWLMPCFLLVWVAVGLPTTHLNSL